METLLVGLIVGLAVVGLIRHLLRELRPPAPGACGCGCSGCGKDASCRSEDDAIRRLP